MRYKDHWLTSPGVNVSPAPFRMGLEQIIHIDNRRLTRQEFADEISSACKYAIRASTMNGQVMDFDPDAMCQNMVVAMLGYWTENGYHR